MSDPAPIIFIHYGPSAYLRQTLTGAARSNPGKKIHFLGDESNRKYCPRNVRFYDMRVYTNGPLLQKFRSVFQPICGSNHRFNKQNGVDYWLRFVFERWFIIREFIEAQSIDRFWTFDSDTLVACDLAQREARYCNVVATEQCRGSCLNGLVNSRTVVEGYTAAMVELFGDNEYLETQRQRLNIHRGLAFNEMDVWQTYRDRERLDTCALGLPQENEVFDDALGIRDGFVPASEKIKSRIPIKMVLVDRRGAAFGLLQPDRQPVRLLTLNLSWLPEYFYKRLLPTCRPLGPLKFNPKSCKELDLSEPLSDRIMGTLFSLRARLEKK